ncbi:hypothetical protein RB195_023675 [Necator americanus]|uniref:Uncharacterized protein n=1 Tax=Necator americanus TaxID=51031 RepID=A0ABR1EKB6_NECAM
MNPSWTRFMRSWRKRSEKSFYKFVVGDFKAKLGKPTEEEEYYEPVLSVPQSRARQTWIEFRRPPRNCWKEGLRGFIRMHRTLSGL